MPHEPLTTNRSLAGLKLLIARDPARAEPLLRAIHAAGGQAQAIKTLEIAPPDDPATAQERLTQACDIAVLTSRHAVERARALVPAWMGGVHNLCVGPATAAAADAAGLANVQSPEGTGAEALLALPALAAPVRKTVHLICGQAPRPLLHAQLCERVEAPGAVQEIHVYQRRAAQLTARAVWSAASASNAWLAPSADAARALLDQANPRSREHLLTLPVVAASSRVVKLLQATGHQARVIVAQAMTTDGLLAALKQLRPR